MSQLATAQLALVVLGCAGLEAACSSRSISLGTIDTSDAGTDTTTDVRLAVPPTIPWIATIAGPLNQTVHAIAVNAANEVFLAGATEFPPQDEFNVDVFAASFNGGNGVQRWMQPIAGRDKGWADSGAAVIPAGGDITVVGTFRGGAADPLGFADLYASTGGAPKLATTLFARMGCQSLEDACDAPLNHKAHAATLVGSALFVGGSATEIRGPAVPWLVHPAPLDLGGWGFVGAMQGTTPLWGRTLGDQFIRAVTSVLSLDNELYVAAVGSASATSDDADSPPVLWLMKFDFAGRMITARSFQTSQGFDSPRIVSVPGGLVVAAGFSGTLEAAGKTFISVGPTDVCVLGVNQNDLSPRWALTLGGDLGNDGGHALVAMPNGDVVVACGTCVNPDGGSVAATSEASGPGLRRLAADGSILRSVAWESNGTVHIGAAAANLKGDGILIGGAFTRRLSVPGGPSATATEDADGFAATVLAP